MLRVYPLFSQERPLAHRVTTWGGLRIERVTGSFSLDGAKACVIDLHDDFEVNIASVMTLTDEELEELREASFRSGPLSNILLPVTMASDELFAEMVQVVKENRALPLFDLLALVRERCSRLRRTVAAVAYNARWRDIATAIGKCACRDLDREYVLKEIQQRLLLDSETLTRTILELLLVYTELYHAQCGDS